MEGLCADERRQATWPELAVGEPLDVLSALLDSDEELSDFVDELSPLLASLELLDELLDELDLDERLSVL